MAENGYVPKGMAQSTRNMWGWDFGRYDKILMVIDDCRFKIGKGDYTALQDYYSAINTLKLNWTSFMKADEKDKYDLYVKMFNENHEKAKKIYNSTGRLTKFFGFAAFWLMKCDDMIMFTKQFKGFGVPVDFEVNESERVGKYLLNPSGKPDISLSDSQLVAYKKYGKSEE